MQHAETRPKVLIVGHGAREHALGQLAARRYAVWATRPTPGMLACVQAVDVDPLDVQGVVRSARALGVAWVLIGPEAALARGMADQLRDQGVAVIGPNQGAARLETSKAFGKQFCQRHGVPTAAWATFRDATKAIDWAHLRATPPVVKADGLAAGKGVTVPLDWQACDAAIVQLLAEHGQIVLEDRLHGVEVSALAIVRDGQWTLLPLCRAYKRAHDGDTGPNTGGMGAICPIPESSTALTQHISDHILAPLVRGLQADGLAFCGVLYAGLMLTDAGPRVLELNVRFGDPEAQVLAAVLGDRLLDALDWLAAADTTPPPPQVLAPACAGVTVVLASAGYPDAPQRGDVITGLPDQPPDWGLDTGLDTELDTAVAIHHAGTALHGDRLVTAGGRAISVTAIADDLPTARRKAYLAADRIRWRGRWMRHDIGVS